MAQGPLYHFVVTDDWRSGPELHFHSDEDDGGDETVYEVQFPLCAPGVVSVFELAMTDVGVGEVRLLKTFALHEEAEHYAKLQYQLLTGDGPFIRDGETESWHARGKRKRIELPPVADDDDEEDLVHDFKLEGAYGDSSLHWIVLADDANLWEAHSLNGCAIW